MIKFFRRIRQRLLAENKVSRYLLYAIGEIILVVIGILIALQINNWNEEKNESKVELTYMQNMLEDLEDDLSIYETVVSRNRVIYKLTDSIVMGIKKSDRRENIRDLSFWVRDVTMQWLFVNPVERTFEQMKSSGHLRLIKDKDVADAISIYYSSLSVFNGYNDASMLWAADYVKAVGKIFDGELMLKIMRERKKQGAKPEDLLSEDPVVINELISSLQYFNGAHTLIEENCLKQAKKAQDLMDLISNKYAIND
ncbi:DUF6090 family protein [Muriicola sp. E247]|uniref:DUF6090 family protein n=1 Tax=Muriicola sp. E247 TaxID=3242730 RepID=UPI0035240EA1